MKPEQQRIAIAEACGWNIKPTQAKGGWKLYCEDVATSFWWNDESAPSLVNVVHMLPAYEIDLNAMHDVISEHDWTRGGILGIEAAQSGYLLHLHRVAGIANSSPLHWGERSQWLVHTATAAQRAEAFLRTLGKWEENQR